MNYINIGKIVNTHGIKGELRILSNFRYKEKVFKKGITYYIGKTKEEFKVNSYRHHKIFEMVTFEGISNINEVLYLKGRQVYINEDDLKLDEDEFLSFKLIGFDVIINNKIVGKVEEIIDTPANEVLKVGKILIPYVKDFVNKIDEDNKTIYINDIGGLL